MTYVEAVSEQRLKTLESIRYSVEPVPNIYPRGASD
jgi:hypothetical protein